MFGLSRKTAEQVVRIGRDEALLDEIRASRIQAAHVQMVRLRFADMGEAEARGRLVRAMEYWDCDALAAARCLVSHLIS